MTEEVEFTIAHTEEKMQKAIAHLEAELVKIRAGKANPQMLEGVRVDYYGTKTPLNQISNISATDAQSLAVQPWDKGLIQVIEKSIIAANLGFNPRNDGNTIWIKVPPLTEERRRDLVKHAKMINEQSKISIRNIRREGNEEIKRQAKQNLAEDEGKEAEELIQKLTSTYIDKADKHLAVKEKEILTI